MIVSKRRFSLDVSKIKIPLLGSSKVFKRQFEAASFKRCASIIKTLENLKYLLRKKIQPRLAWEIAFLKISMENI